MSDVRPKTNLPLFSTLVDSPVMALTISQPYASLIASGEKWIENREWWTNYHGPLAIHAGKGTQYLTRRDLQNYPHGGIVAITTLLGCIQVSMIEKLLGSIGYRTCDDIRNHEYAEGPWCWILGQVQPCQLELCRGSLGLWRYSGPARW